MHGSLTVVLAYFRIWLSDVSSKIADVFCREATKATFTTVDTLVYYPSCHASDLIRHSFVDLRGCLTCYFDPDLAVA